MEKVEAERALAELEAGRRATAHAERRSRALLLASSSVLVFMDYAAKDHVPDPTARRLTTALCTTAALCLHLLDMRYQQVHPVGMGPDESRPEVVRRLVRLLLVWMASERVLIVGLRRSRVRRPNTVSGLVLALTRPVWYAVLDRRLPRPRVDV
jgi:hypothetical protein